MNGTAPEWWRAGAPEPDDWPQLRQECCRGDCGAMIPCIVGDANPDIPLLNGPARKPPHVAYTTQFAENVRDLGGVVAEAGLIVSLGAPIDEADS